MPQENLKAKVEKVKATARKVVTKLPTTTVQGFHDGRRHGRKFVEEGVPYGAGAAVGFGFGASEAVVGALAFPVNALVGWAAWAIGGGSQGQNENHGAAEPE